MAKRMAKRKAQPTFGQVLRAAREERGIGLRALARAVGMSATYLSKIELDRLPPPSDEKLKALVKAVDSPEFDRAVIALMAKRAFESLTAGTDTLWNLRMILTFERAEAIPLDDTKYLVDQLKRRFEQFLANLPAKQDSIAPKPVKRDEYKDGGYGQLR